ncbi:MAG: spermidine/putrescine ABC transporter substrate-binding protein [Bryobacteraceae bacterium]
MKRRVFLMGLTGCSSGGPRLNVFNWSNYVGPDTIRKFEAQSGVHVRYGIYESNEEMLARVQSGNSGWDVVFPSNYLIRPMREQGLLAPLDRALLPNLSNLDERFRAPAWDERLEWSLPYMWGASGIVFRREIAPKLTSWAGLWREDLQGRITMLDDPAEVLGACLKKLGYSINSTDPEELRLAQREAVAQKRMLRAYLNAEVRDSLIAGDVQAAHLWATTAQQAMDAQSELEFVYPSEGFALYADCAGILRESRRFELAHRFLNYLLEPEVAVGVVAATRTATANGAARRLLNETNATLYPPAEVLARGEWFQALPAAAQRLRDRLWTEIKSA